jgi:hypothetical protein
LKLHGISRGSPTGEYRAGKKAAASRNSAHHGSNRHGHYLGNLVILEAVDVVQLDDGCEIVRQLRQRGVNLLARQPGRDLVEYQIGIARDKFLVGVLEASDGDELPAAGAAFFGLAENGAQNSIQPGADARRISQLIEPDPGAATSLLHRVLGVGAGVRAARREGEQTIEVREDERVEARVPLGELKTDWSTRRRRN